jgi:CDP-glucose 4,6-dehydratase
MVNLTQLQPYFEKKKVLITGHTGFKGAWLLQIMHLLKAEIYGYALTTIHEYDLFNQIKGADLCKQHIIGDIRDYEHLKKVILDIQPDFIFHLAAQPLVIESYQNPLNTFETNGIGTAHVLDALRYLKTPCICINITTDKVYENPEDGKPFLETDKLGGYDPYSASKAVAEIVISSYTRSFFNPNNYSEHQKSIASVRAGNVIGGGDFADHRIVPDIISSLKNKEDIKVRNPNAIRPWQHVLEPLGGYILLATKMSEQPNQFCDAYNFGPSTKDVLSVKELVEIAIKTLGGGTWTDTSLSYQFHEAKNLQLDITKAKEKLNWVPKMTARESVINTMLWYSNKAPSIDKCRAEIKEYFK